MAEEQQVTKEPQQVTTKEPQQVTTKEPQQVTTKQPQQVTTKQPQQVTTNNPNKVKAGKRLAEYNRKKREEKKAQREARRGVNQYHSIGAVIAVGVIGNLGYYIYQTKKGQATTGRGASTSGELPNMYPRPPTMRNPSKLLHQSNKLEID